MQRHHLCRSLLLLEATQSDSVAVANSIAISVAIFISDPITISVWTVSISIITVAFPDAIRLTLRDAAISCRYHYDCWLVLRPVRHSSLR